MNSKFCSKFEENSKFRTNGGEGRERERGIAFSRRKWRPPRQSKAKITLPIGLSLASRPHPLLSASPWWVPPPTILTIPRASSDGRGSEHRRRPSDPDPTDSGGVQTPPPPRHIVRSKARPRTCPGRAARVTRAVALPSPRAPHVTGPPGRRIAIGRPWIRRQWHGPTASRRGSADRRSGGDGAVTASGSRRGEGERER